jgi:hypothetical protein
MHFCSKVISFPTKRLHIAIHAAWQKVVKQKTRKLEICNIPLLVATAVDVAVETVDETGNADDSTVDPP